MLGPIKLDLTPVRRRKMVLRNAHFWAALRFDESKLYEIEIFVHPNI